MGFVDRFNQLRSKLKVRHRNISWPRVVVLTLVQFATVNIFSIESKKRPNLTLTTCLIEIQNELSQSWMKKLLEEKSAHQAQQRLKRKEQLSRNHQRWWLKKRRLKEGLMEDVEDS